jgi:hypothetical protein
MAFRTKACLTHTVVLVIRLLLVLQSMNTMEKDRIFSAPILVDSLKILAQ